MNGASAARWQKLTDPLNRVTTWKWDGGGRMLEKLIARRCVTKTSYAYEPLSGRLATVKRPNEARRRKPNGHLPLLRGWPAPKEDYTDAATPDVTYVYETNNLGRLTSVVDGIVTHACAYMALTAGTAGAGRLQYDKRPAHPMTASRASTTGRIASAPTP